ncbi:MAG: nucleotidyl transferase AbiEii/AbiGii toxin family protein [Elusimicrobia bacterium]|nr:nucleotidyl transferase AbiEii/AbiGii toxin family protein [Elusimicrobiota bacterium]
MPHKHIEMLATVAQGLKTLREPMAFVGGATVGLHIDDPAAPTIRLSDDVDCVVEVASQLDFHKLEQHLTALGFKHPPIEVEGPLCRRIFAGILVDFMPTDGKILGFKNRWYSEGLKNAVPYRLPNGQTIRIFSLPYLLATKIEAFLGRGNKDYYSSSDVEDIVSILDGSMHVSDHISEAPHKVKKYLQDHFARFVSDRSFLESLERHTLSPDRAKRIINLLGHLAGSL